MKTTLLTISALILSVFCFAQYPVVTIKQIQEVTQANLGNCIDDENFFGDTVIVRAKVVMNGDLAVPSGIGAQDPHKNFWLQQGDGGSFKGIDVFALSSTNPIEDPHNLLAGDSIEVIGVVDSYNGESEIIPLDGSSITILGQNQPINYQVISVGDLNDNQRNNILTTGEQWEGAFVEIQNVTVAAISTFGGGRTSFDVQDAQGNLINVSDRFTVGRTQAVGGSFVPPIVGDQFDAIRGIILHDKNSCPGAPGQRGYEINPFDITHYNYGASAPAISNIARTPAVPTSAQTVGVQATITDLDGVVVSAKIFYATGASSTSYTQVNMTNTGGDLFEADIPAQSDGTLVKWYIQAEDDSALTNTLPNTDPSIETFLYRVRDNGLTIYDLQYTPFDNGDSPFTGETVTVEGVVTATQQTSGDGDLGYVYIQQENQPTYAGIWLRSATSAATLGILQRGQKVSVEGIVEESFGMTTLSDITSATPMGTGNIDPTVLNPDDFSVSTASLHEQYEGMLIQFSNPNSSERIYVTDTNVDAPSNFAEYRIGTDPYDPNVGSRILAGRVSSSSPSSLFVSFVNGPQWVNESGTMNVRPYFVDQAPTFGQEGNSMASVTGILYYGFGEYKLLPRNNNDFVDYSGPIDAAIANANDTVCLFDSIQFMNMSSIIADDVSWDFGNGQTSDIDNPITLFNTLGSYTVSLTVKNSYDNDSAVATRAIEVVEGGTCGVGILDNADENQVTVYPNPLDEAITVSTGFENGEVYTITIYDIQGREVYKRVTMLATETIGLDFMEVGTYILMVKDNAGSSIQTEKIIKK